MKHLFACFLVSYTICHLAFAGTGRIYGKVTTTDDEVFEGWIRWDKQEAFWDDYLDGIRKGYIKNDLDKKILLKVYGPFWVYRRQSEFRQDPQTGIQFGHIELLEKTSGSSATVTLKDGRKLKLGPHGRDIGSSNSGIEIDDLNFGKIVIKWREFKQVEFKEETSQYVEVKSQNDEYRLYGRVETWEGDVFEGYVIWDWDESLSTHILDGKSRRREMEIPFTNIKWIERDSRSSVVVELTNDTRLSLSGSNDVGQGNRGMAIKDPVYGEVEISWKDFGSVKFEKNVTKFIRNYDDFDGGRPLYGEVYTKYNDRYRGYICWDNDECFTTDVLDGKYEEYDINIEFSKIYSIQYRSRRSCIVETVDGKKMHLSGSNDVNDANAGIFIMQEDGSETKVRWTDFEKVIFK
ncbi:hypothetical protein JXJ21_14495 [candidate division KSB1 bacterium]|nr:hypothetical protein [candidate division KSB1 bacterium]